MKARTMMAGAAALVALAAVGVGAVSAQPRDDKPSKGRTTDDARFDDGDFDPGDGCCFFGGGPGFGPGAGRGWARGGRGFGGPGMRGPGFGGRGFAGGFGWGGPGPDAMAFGRGAGLLRGGDRIAEALDLSDAQRRKLREIREDHHRQMIQARADMDLARMDLAKLLQDDAATASVDRQIDVLARMHADQMKSMFATHRSALDVLTAKQRDQLKGLREWGPAGDGDDARPRRGSRR